MPSLFTATPARGFVQLLLRGVGQVMFQNNAYSGLLFLVGIFYHSWPLGIAAILGAALSTSTARLLGYPKEDIQNGLYGFNGALTGIAVWHLVGVSPLTAGALLVGSMAAAPVQHYLQKVVPPYTAPFILITWALLGILTAVFRVPLAGGAAAPDEPMQMLMALANGFGQVMLQQSPVTGSFFLAGLLVNTRVSALYAAYAALLSTLLGLLMAAPVSVINAGVFGYNAILCAIALADQRRSTFFWISLAVVASVLLNTWLAQAGLITLTAPFVLVTWWVLAAKKYATQQASASR